MLLPPMSLTRRRLNVSPYMYIGEQIGATSDTCSKASARQQLSSDLHYVRAVVGVNNSLDPRENNQTSAD